MKLRTVFPGALLLVGGLWAGSQFRSAPPSREPLPVIVEQLRSMRELKTQSLSANRVFELESSRTTGGWIDHAPVLSNVAQKLTQNKILVSATGTVEAGVDLSKASVQQEGETLVITLPPATLSAANVRAEVHQWKRGLIWTDVNLPYDAETKMSAWIRGVAERNGLASKAQKEAEQAVRELIGTVTDQPVKFKRAG